MFPQRHLEHCSCRIRTSSLNEIIFQLYLLCWMWTVGGHQFLLYKKYTLCTGHIHHNQGLWSICGWYHRLRKTRLQLADVSTSWLVACPFTFGRPLAHPSAPGWIYRWISSALPESHYFQWFAFYLRRPPVASSFLLLQAHL